MDYSRYYTPPAIADLLVRQICTKTPLSIIDICCGSCNLLNAAKKRWNNATLFGVDIIKHTMPNVTVFESDGRKYAIDNAGQYSLVLANPPFDSVKKKREYKALFSEMENINLKYETSRLENEMLLANLKLLDKNGTLLIIMPSTFVESEKNKSMRIYLANYYYVNKIIKLPKETFGAANISTYALIVKKSKPKKRMVSLIDIKMLNGVYHVSKTVKLYQENLSKGNWYLNGCYTLKNNKCDIKRGNISSQLFSKHGIPVLHTAKAQNQWRPSIRYTRIKQKSEVYAEHGDIVISRIGKSAGQWYIHDGDQTLISDCLYRLKDPDGIIAKNLKGKKYGFSTKGVATQYITMSDFLSWYQSIIDFDKEEKYPQITI